MIWMRVASGRVISHESENDYSYSKNLDAMQKNFRLGRASPVITAVRR